MDLKKTILILATYVVLFFSSFLFAQDSQNPFIVELDQPVKSVQIGGEVDFWVSIQVPPGHFLYAKKTKLSFDSSSFVENVKVNYPEVQKHFDQLFNKETDAYLEDILISAAVKISPDFVGEQRLKAVLKYQGCSAKLCYLPIKKNIEILLNIKANSATQTVQTQSSSFSVSFWDLVSNPSVDAFVELAFYWLLLIAFVTGILSCFTGCILPIIPLTLAFVGAKQKDKMDYKRSLFLVLGMALMPGILGIIAAQFGKQFGFLFQYPLFILAIALLFLFCALVLFDLVPLSLPSSWQNRLSRVGGKSHWGAFSAGMTVGLIAAPCAGPLLIGLLGIVLKTKDPLSGFFIMATYGLGMGLCFFGIINSYQFIQSKLSKTGLGLFKKLLAVIMLVPAAYYFWSYYQVTTISEHTQSKDSLWHYSYKDGLKKAQAESKPIILDFYASWCVPCVQLEQQTFSQEKLREKAKDFIMIKVDCSKSSRQCVEVSEKYSILAMPAVLFLDSQGRRVQSIKDLNGFVDVDRMMEIMDRLQKATQP